MVSRRIAAQENPAARTMPMTTTTEKVACCTVLMDAATGGLPVGVYSDFVSPNELGD